MDKIRFLGVLLCCMYVSNITAQTGKGIPNKILVQITENQTPYIAFELSKEQTIYSVCKFFNVALDDAMEMNNISNPQDIPEGRTIHLPINYHNVNLEKGNNPKSVPLVYKTKPKETLFRISKIYFKQDVRDFVERNELSGFSLDIGQELIVGYFTPQQPLEHDVVVSNVPTDSTKKNRDNSLRSKHVKRKQLGSPTSPNNSPSYVGVVEKEAETGIVQQDSSIVIDIDTIEKAEVDSTKIVEVVEMPKTRTVSRKGIAFWDKKGSDYENMMVLHKSAAVNTIIKIKNPINGAEVFARVVGKIPKNAFKKDIEVVISPAVAKKIGALDSRCQVSMTYQQNI